MMMMTLDDDDAWYDEASCLEVWHDEAWCDTACYLEAWHLWRMVCEA